MSRRSGGRRRRWSDAPLLVSVGVSAALVFALAWGIEDSTSRFLSGARRIAAQAGAGARDAERDAFERSVLEDRSILLALLAAVTAALAVSVVVARRDLLVQRGLEDALRDLTIRDSLTGLYNRRELSNVLARATAARGAARGRVVFVMADIDHFKPINDLHGHATGDTILKWVANRLRGGVRVGDVVARYGGEEFALVLRDADAERAYEIAERLRVSIASRPFVLPGAPAGSTPIPVTLSFGIAELSPADETALTLIERGDRALYEAKRSGRNRTVLSAAEAA